MFSLANFVKHICPLVFRDVLWDLCGLFAALVKGETKAPSRQEEDFSPRFWYIVGKIYQDFTFILFPSIPLENGYPFKFLLYKVCKRIQLLRSNFAATLALHVSNYEKWTPEYGKKSLI